MQLHTEQFGYYDQRQWHVAPGKFIVKVGASSADIKLQQAVDLTGETVSKPLREHYFSQQNK